MKSLCDNSYSLIFALPSTDRLSETNTREILHKFINDGFSSIRSRISRITLASCHHRIMKDSKRDAEFTERRAMTGFFVRNVHLLI